MAAAMSGSGARLGADRASGWARQLRVTPLSDGGWLVGAAVDLRRRPPGGPRGRPGRPDLRRGVHMQAAAWLLLVVTLLVGTVPIALIGLVISLALKGESA